MGTNVNYISGFIVKKSHTNQMLRLLETQWLGCCFILVYSDLVDKIYKNVD